MIHFLPLASDSGQAPENSELLERMASLKRALRLVDPFGGGPSSDFEEEANTAAYICAREPVKRCLDRRSERLVGAAAAGLESVVSERAANREPHDVSLKLLAREIRAGLADLSSLLRA